MFCLYRLQGDSLSDASRPEEDQHHGPSQHASPQHGPLHGSPHPHPLLPEHAAVNMPDGNGPHGLPHHLQPVPDISCKLIVHNACIPNRTLFPIQCTIRMPLIGPTHCILLSALDMSTMALLLLLLFLCVCGLSGVGCFPGVDTAPVRDQECESVSQVSFPVSVFHPSVPPSPSFPLFFPPSVTKQSSSPYLINYHPTISPCPPPPPTCFVRLSARPVSITLLLGRGQALTIHLYRPRQFTQWTI